MLLKTFAQASSHITASMIAGLIHAMDPRVVVLHNTIVSAYKEKKLKACYQTFARGRLCEACPVQFLRQQSWNFWLNDVTDTVKKQNCV